MNSKEIIEAFSYVAKEKNVEKTYLTNIIEEIFTSMLLKKYGEEYEPNFSTIVNMERGEIEIFHEKEVVNVVKNEITEMLAQGMNYFPHMNFMSLDIMGI